MAVVSKSTILGYLGGTTEEVLNQISNILESHFHKTEGKIIKTLTEDSGVITINFSDDTTKVLYSKEELDAIIAPILNNQVSGFIARKNKADLPATGDADTAYFVLDDTTDENNNGTWGWDGSDYYQAGQSAEAAARIAGDELISLKTTPILHYIGIDDYSTAESGQLRWDSSNSRALKYNGSIWSLYTAYSDSTVFIYKNTKGYVLLKIVSDNLIIINEPSIPEISVWEADVPSPSTSPRRFRDYHFDSLNNVLRVRTEQFWDYESIPVSKLVSYNSTTYQKTADQAVLQKITNQKDLTEAISAVEATASNAQTAASNAQTAATNAQTEIATYDTVFEPSSTILGIKSEIGIALKSIKIEGDADAIDKEWELHSYSRGNKDDAVNRPYIRLTSDGGTTYVNCIFPTRTSDTDTSVHYVQKADNSAVFNVAFAYNLVTSVAYAVNDTSTAKIDKKKALVYKGQYTKYPIAFCKSKSLYDDLLVGIEDLETFGIPLGDEVFIERTYNSGGNFRIELNYTSKELIDGTKYNFLWRNDVVNIDFVTDKITALEFENNVAGSTARAIMYVNFSKINQNLSYTSSQENNVKFSKSCNKSTYVPEADVILPKIIPAVQNRDFRICFESAVVDGTKRQILGNGFDIKTNKNTGKYYQQKQETIGNSTLKVKFLEGNKILKYASSTISTVSASEGNGVTKKVVVCGDSKTDNATKLAWLIDELFANDVMSITLLGTRDTGTYPNEGYSGRNVIELTEDSTLNGVTNPFYNAALSGDKKWDIATFITAVGDTPDIVWIDHGANQVSANWEDIKDSYDHILANVTAYNTANATDIRVVFSVQESASLLPDINGNKSALKSSILALGRNMINEYDDRQSENLFICPQYLNVDLEWDFPWAYVPRMNNIGALEPRTSDSIHCGRQSFETYKSGTTYNTGDQVSNGGEDFAVIKDGVVGVTPVDDKINYAIIEKGIGAGYRNIAEAYFNLIKYMETV